MFLSRPDEERLWVLVAGLLVTALVLLVVSLQLPWYTATYSVADVELRGVFDFREARLAAFYEGEPLQLGEQEELPGQVYGDGSAFGQVMNRAGFMVGLGLVGVAAVAALAYMHRSGRFSSPGLIKASWIVAALGLFAGIAYFTLNAATAGANEIYTQMSRLAQQYPELGVPPHPPQPMFWGTQAYANGDLASAPGAGWLFAILGLLNLIVATLLLYQFPAREPVEDEAAAAGFRAGQEGDQDESPAGRRDFPAVVPGLQR